MAGTSHVFSEIYLHVTWHCLENRALLTPEMERYVHGSVEEQCRKSKGVHFQCIGGTENHIHQVIRTEPFVPVSDYIGKIKGGSSHEANQRFGRGALQWQRGYGVVSFSKRYLQTVVNYVANQKEHHKKQTLNEVLERVGPPPEKPR